MLMMHYVFLQIKALLAPGMQTGKMKKFMTTLARTHLEVIMMLAVRENTVMIEVGIHLDFLSDILFIPCINSRHKLATCV